ncbi:cellulose synthase operon protein YhjU [Chromobacterium violaceum]|uniref:Cellulose synthase operon protein YhjU n=1 Tax=Chromobacterium violaceum TaxID=536 RepID=A0A447TEY3_CHRVL|nr:cellulose synthase operon protein YhjU [Chromobacterium violaceum]
MLARSPFGADYQPESYAQDLPATPFVSENANFTVMQSGSRYLMQSSAAIGTTTRCKRRYLDGGASACGQGAAALAR